MSGNHGMNRQAPAARPVADSRRGSARWRSPSRSPRITGGNPGVGESTVEGQQLMPTGAAHSSTLPLIRIQRCNGMDRHPWDGRRSGKLSCGHRAASHPSCDPVSGGRGHLPVRGRSGVTLPVCCAIRRDRRHRSHSERWSQYLLRSERWSAPHHHNSFADGCPH